MTRNAEAAEPRAFPHLLGYLLAAPFLLLLLLALFAAPLELVVEAFDLFRMQHQANGTVVSITIVRGGKGTSRADVLYRFSVAGKEFTSTRYLPGVFANYGTISGGATIAQNYVAQQAVVVHYDQHNPERCALVRGVFKGSVAITLLVWGLVIAGGCQEPKRPNVYWIIGSCFGLSCILSGFSLMFVGPLALPIGQLPWYLLVWGMAFVGLTACRVNSYTRPLRENQPFLDESDREAI